jgi:hypothetical protein
VERTVALTNAEKQRAWRERRNLQLADYEEELLRCYEEIERFKVKTVVIYSVQCHVRDKWQVEEYTDTRRDAREARRALMRSYPIGADNFRIRRHEIGMSAKELAKFLNGRLGS